MAMTAQLNGFRVIERGRTTGYIYAVSNPLDFHRAETLAYFMRETSKIGGHEVTCYFVIPTADDHKW